MPPPLFYDPNQYDLTQIVRTRDDIYAVLPHRYEFQLLDGVNMIDAEAKRMIVFSDIRPDAWWTRGHIPGKPLLPGVLMIEMAGQAAAFFYHTVLANKGFLAFAAVDEVKFRGTVEPPCRLHMLGISIDLRPRRVVCAFQGLVDGKLVFETRMTGIPI